MAAKMSVLWLILSSSSYLRSAKARFPLSSSLSTKKNIFKWMHIPGPRAEVQGQEYWQQPGQLWNWLSYWSQKVQMEIPGSFNTLPKPFLEPQNLLLFLLVFRIHSMATSVKEDDHPRTLPGEGGCNSEKKASNILYYTSDFPYVCLFVCNARATPPWFINKIIREWW